MPRGRPPLEIGAWGNISREEITPGKWEASGRVRDADGVTRQVARRTPRGVYDRKGAAAERELKRHLAERIPPSDATITPDSTIEELWKKYRQHLVDRKRASNTLLRNDGNSKIILTSLRAVRIREMAQVQRGEEFIRTVETEHGPGAARSVRATLSGMMSMAVRYGALAVNPIRETLPADASARKPARSLENDQIERILHDIEHSQLPCPPIQKGKDGTVRQPRYKVPTVAKFCARADIPDIVNGFAGTGVRASELFAFLWDDFDPDAKILTVTGKVVREPGVGMVRITVENAKNIHRALPLADVTVERLLRRRDRMPDNELGLIFPSAKGTIMDPTNFNDQWRRVRTALGYDFEIDLSVTGHTWRKTVLSIGEEAGLPTSELADHAGHAEIMTRQSYLGRKRPGRRGVADALNQALPKGMRRSGEVAGNSGE